MGVFCYYETPNVWKCLNTTRSPVPLVCHRDTRFLFIYHRICFTAVISEVNPFHRSRPNGDIFSPSTPATSGPPLSFTGAMPSPLCAASCSTTIRAPLPLLRRVLEPLIRVCLPPPWPPLLCLARVGRAVPPPCIRGGRAPGPNKAGPYLPF
jgi:hypothetical protein